MRSYTPVRVVLKTERIVPTNEDIDEHSTERGEVWRVLEQLVRMNHLYKFHVYSPFI